MEWWPAASSHLSSTLASWQLGGCLSIAPRYLEYFNELARGSRGGHTWLVDSNVDWGQDLLRLADYAKARKLESIHLADFGRVDPAVYGIHFTPLVEGESRGTAVVSAASFLMGRPYSHGFGRAPMRNDRAHLEIASPLISVAEVLDRHLASRANDQALSGGPDGCSHEVEPVDGPSPMPGWAAR